MDAFDRDYQAMQGGSTPAQPTPQAQAVDAFDRDYAAMNTPDRQPTNLAPLQANPLVSAAAGVNSVIGRIPANVVPMIGRADDAILNFLTTGNTEGNNTAGDNASKYFAQQRQLQQQLMAANPNAAGAGRGLAEAETIAPQVEASLITPAIGAFTGATFNNTLTDPNASPIQQGINTVAGAIGGGAEGIYGAAANIGRGLKYGFQNVGNLAQNAINNAIAKVGGDIKDVMPKDAFQAFDKLKSDAGEEANRLYALRNNAVPAGMTVDRSSTSAIGTLQTQLQQQVEQGAPTEVNRALNEVNSIMGNGKPLNFQDAHRLLSSIRSSAFDAGQSQNYTLANQLNNVRDAFESDIENAVSKLPNGQQVQQLHDAAQNFYHTTYAPLRDIGAQSVLADKLGQTTFTGALKSVLNDKAGVNAIQNQGGDQATQILGMAHLNGLKEAATPGLATGDLTGKLNIPVYTKAVGDALKNYPDIYSKIFPQMNALKDALTATQFLAKGTADQSIHSIGQKIMMGGLSTITHLGAGAEGYMHAGIPGAALSVAAAHFLPKAPFFYSAGKMLQNPATRALLSKAGNLPADTAPAIKSYYNKKIAAEYAKQASTIPAKFAPFFDSSNQNNQ